MVGKEPWEMTRTEYFGDAVSKLWTPEGKVHLKKGQRLQPKEALDLEAACNKEHKQMVQQALASGKPVPAEVLKDYPELFRPYVKDKEKRTAPRPKSQGLGRMPKQPKPRAPQRGYIIHRSGRRERQRRGTVI
jgi:hypothetical protein